MFLENFFQELQFEGFILVASLKGVFFGGGKCQNVGGGGLGVSDFFYHSFAGIFTTQGFSKIP